MASCEHPGVTLFVPEHGGPVIQCMGCMTSWPLQLAPLPVLQRLGRMLVAVTAERTAQAN